MAATLYSLKSMPLLSILLLLLITFSRAAARRSSKSSVANNHDLNNASVSPPRAILVAILLLGFFYIYLCCENSALAPADAPGVINQLTNRRSRRGARGGLDSTSLAKIPTMVYSSIKGRKLFKDTNECVVCLSEFKDDDIIRFLPNCNHFYHRDCIDVWFATHVTCPLCRSNLAASDEDD